MKPKKTLYMKKRILYTLSLLIFSTLCLSQTVLDAAPTVSDSLTKIYVNGIDQEAQFPGGAESWRKYLQKNLRINVPLKNGAPDGTYKVIVRFMVAIDGTLDNFFPETKFGFGMEDEVIRLIKQGPKWQPARRYDRKINAYRIQPITFVFAR